VTVTATTHVRYLQSTLQQQGHKAVEELLSILESKPPPALDLFKRFCEALTESGQEVVVKRYFSCDPTDNEDAQIAEQLRSKTDISQGNCESHTDQISDVKLLLPQITGKMRSTREIGTAIILQPAQKTQI